VGRQAPGRAPAAWPAGGAAASRHTSSCARLVVAVPIAAVPEYSAGRITPSHCAGRPGPRVSGH